jgi:hypothetical protein
MRELEKFCREAQTTSNMNSDDQRTVPQMVCTGTEQH